MTNFEERNNQLTTTNHSTIVESHRASKEIEAKIIIAKRFPRDEAQAYNRLMNTCKRSKFASQALYSYPRGGAKVEGPSIRLAEAAARCWGNMDFGICEIERKDGESTIETYCWDMETNVTARIKFTAKHVREKRNGTVALTSDRDIYELMANQGARRLRKCILELIPEDVIEAAVETCNKAMLGSVKDPAETIRSMTEKFKELGVTVEQLEKKVGNKLSACSVTQIHNLAKIYTSLNDGASTISDWFETETRKSSVERKMEDEAKTETEKSIEDEL